MTDLSTLSSHDSRSKKEITALSNEDVLVGRGKGFSSYIGNQKFLKTIEERKAEYNGTDDNTKKLMIARQILNEIKGKGGRFLRLVNENQRVRDVVKQGVWCEASSCVAMEKIKQALRQKRGSSGTDIKNGSQGHHQSINGQNIENAFLPFFNNTLSPMMLSNPVSSTFVGTVGRFALATPLLHPFFQEELIPSAIASVPLSHYGLYHPSSLIPSVSDLRLSLFQRALFAVQQQVDANSVHPLLVHNSMLSNNDSKSSDEIPLRIGDSDKDTSSENLTTLADDGISESFLSMFGIDATQPRVTDEQCAIEKNAMSAEERASALADMFGKNCCIDVHKDKRARKDLDVDSIAFLVRQMRSEIDSIPLDQKVALMEAQAKCSRIEEFSDKRLERFLRCEGMNTKVRLFL